ncbi:hypothetical protein [Winogradskyella schleiferi]|uniref:hypothetical protein n=1 Tax=Winogradskyella schleiferi TaxID=2686078 RepID=UPI0015BD1464|nr:hypothetical protein [Winogradskyella schleiferi]
MGRLITNIGIVFFVLTFSYIGNAQKDSNKLSLTQDVPSEKVFLKINDSIILSGETLYYDFYSLITNSYSDISKIAYVELVDRNRNVVFKHKLKLLNGRASGDFFLPTSLKTGQYKLIGYTNWSLNNYENAYAHNDVYLINPFLNAWDNNLISTFGATEKYIEIGLVNKKLMTEQKNVNSEITLFTIDSVYAKRQKVTLQIENKEGASNFGSYTLSVKKMNSIFVAHNNTNQNIENEQKVKELRLPDYRGELISGKVINIKDNKPVEKISVSLSMQGDDVIYKSATTNKSGEFYFNMIENYDDKVGYLQLELKDQHYYKILLDSTYFDAYDDLKFYPLKINKDIRNWVENRSVFNQVESAYFNLKRDSIINQQNPLPFYGKPDLVYVLDDYTRFKTLKETFVEVVQQAAIRNDGQDYKFLVYENNAIDNTRLFDEASPLLIFNGVHFMDEKYVVEYDPKEIESINLVKGTYIDGLIFYNGIIDIRLKTPNNFNFDQGSVLKLNVKPVINPKRYFYQTHESIDKHVPDFRTLLLWKPRFIVDAPRKEIEFYTSSVTGFYEIVLEGFTEQGEKIYINSIFEVK